MFDGGNYLDPIAVGIGDEVNPHLFVFVTNAPHFAMFCIRTFEVVHPERKMKLTFPEIVCLRMVFQPGQFDFKLAVLIFQKYDDKVLRGLATGFFQPERLFVKPQRCFEIADVVIVVNDFELHVLPHGSGSDMIQISTNRTFFQAIDAVYVACLHPAGYNIDTSTSTHSLCGEIGILYLCL